MRKNTICKHAARKWPPFCSLHTDASVAFILSSTNELLENRKTQPEYFLTMKLFSFRGRWKPQLCCFWNAIVHRISYIININGAVVVCLLTVWKTQLSFWSGVIVRAGNAGKWLVLCAWRGTRTLEVKILRTVRKPQDIYNSNNMIWSSCKRYNSCKQFN